MRKGDLFMVALVSGMMTAAFNAFFLGIDDTWSNMLKALLASLIAATLSLAIFYLNKKKEVS